MTKLYKHESRSYHPFTRHNVSYYASGKFKGKRILVVNNEFEEDKQRYFQDPIPYSYSFLNPEDATFNVPINTELKVGMYSFYCHLNYFQRLNLRLHFKEHWTRKAESWKWIVSTLISIIALIISLVALYKD